MKTPIILCLSLFLFCTYSLQAQQGENENSQDTDINHQHEGVATEQGNPEAYDHPEKVTADFEDFPNLHPLVVHIPIMLLILAAILQIIGFFVFKNEISWIVLGFVTVGFIGAYLAAVTTHPHVSHDLPGHARKVFEKHDMFAMWTLWLSGIAVLLKAVSHFFLKRVRWAEAIVAIVLLASAYTVSMAGHHGSQLVFIEGVGPQGKYLETEGHSH